MVKYTLLFAVFSTLFWWLVPPAVFFIGIGAFGDNPTEGARLFGQIILGLSPAVVYFLACHYAMKFALLRFSQEPLE